MVKVKVKVNVAWCGCRLSDMLQVQGICADARDLELAVGSQTPTP